MWPWGHLAVGYLLYATYTRYRHLEPPAGLAVVWLALGTQFPDLVDKPLAYWTPLLPGGRALAHSLLFAVPLLAAVLYLGLRWSRPRGAVAFAIGYATHPLVDAVGPILDAEFGKLTYLLWPLLPVPEYETTSFEYHRRTLAAAVEGSDSAWLLAPWNDFFVAQLWLFAAALVLWLFHGAPPLPSLRRWVGARVRAS